MFRYRGRSVTTSSVYISLQILIKEDALNTNYVCCVLLALSTILNNVDEGVNFF